MPTRRDAATLAQTWNPRNNHRLATVATKKHHLIQVLIAVLLVAVQASWLVAEERPFPRKAKRIVFLGDSITHAGQYISLIEAQLRLAGDNPVAELINLGLPSETCSGLSEPEHPFPRPNVHERIDRALAKLKPDVVVACYGMNDGIYYPLSEERFAAYRDGIDAIIDKVGATDAKLILMTPPAFDPLPLKKRGKVLPAGAEQYSWKAIYEDYDDVMREYAQWLIKQQDRVEMVIDLHTPVNDYVAEKRKRNPDFTMSPDGVHVNHEGHAVLAAAILKAWGLEQQAPVEPGLMTLISKRQKLMHDAWLSEVGHQRPGVKAGLPIEQAKAGKIELDKQIQARTLRAIDALQGKHDDVDHVHLPASTRQGELPMFADYYLWIPPGVERLRGVIVHQHGCGAGASSAGLTAADDLHWRALAAKWDCALMGSSYECLVGNPCRLWCDPRGGSAQRFLQALDRFADETGHDELKDVPWCLWGHSGGGFWASIMQTLHPDRIAAIWLQSGTAYGRWESGEIEAVKITDAVYGVPVIACPGLKEKDHERFHTAYDGSINMMRAYRAQGAPFAVAVDPRTGHECGDARYLAIAFFDECLALRLPEASSDSQQLKPVNRDSLYVETMPKDRRVVSAGKNKRESADAMWLPSDAFAEKWLEFTETGALADATPPPAPRDIEVKSSEQGIELSWHADADFESGLRGFRITRDGKEVATLPANPRGRFGRPIFQTMSYSDTPEQPLAEMRWLDRDDATDAKVVYEIVSINSVGLESQAATKSYFAPSK